MRLLFVAVVASSLLGCSAADGDRAARAGASIESIHTDLAGESCRNEIDRSDPNETPFRMCPGVAGYELIVRHVESGRQSIDVVDPAHRVLPLDYQEIITRSMSNLDGKAEWRVATRNGKPVPVALIVRVQAREDADDPEKVTTTYLAVAKITPDQTCVTDRIAEGTQPDAAVRRAADSAPDRPCAPPRPQLR